ncbi:MAG: SRPBCC family protein [Deltaproteobacteria bacterium]|nr:SRPBCC family protein [Deltaproteobacteria bacterium]
MTTLRHEIHARCPPAAVWAVLSDLTAVARFNPMVTRATFVGEPRTGVGAQRACEVLPRGRVLERVTRWDEGEALGLEVVESDWPVHYMRWVTRVEAEGEGSRISQEL